MKVGAFGGTFDPIHIGHLIAAEEARVQLRLDQVLFIPTGQPWLKACRKITEAYHRMAMVELAVASNPAFRASNMEIIRPGPTYTVDTLEALREQLGPQAGIYLVLGRDSLAQLERWHLPQRLFDLATLVGMPRPGSQEFDPRVLDAILPGASAKVMLLEAPMIGVRGTEIRQRVAAGLSIKYQVPETVEKYIFRHGLYRA